MRAHGFVSCLGCAGFSGWDGGSVASAGAGVFSGAGGDWRSGDLGSYRARAHVFQGSCRHAAATGEVIWSVLCGDLYKVVYVRAMPGLMYMMSFSFTSLIICSKKLFLIRKIKSLRPLSILVTLE